MSDADPSDALVLLRRVAATSRHKKIFPALYAMAKRGHLHVPVIGVASSQWTLDDLQRPRARQHRRSTAAASTTKARSSSSPSLAALRRRRLQRPDDVRAAASRQLGERRKRPAHYLAIPPSLFGTVVEGARHVGLRRRTRASSSRSRSAATSRRRRSSTGSLHTVFPEQSIFRIDHYLGKEAIQNILYFRFANSFLEPIWNRNYVAPGPDHDGRGLRRAGPRRVLRGGRRAARRHPEPPASRWSRCSRWSRRVGPGVEALRDAQGAGVRARCETLEPRRPRARPVRGLPRRGRRRARLRRRDVRRGARCTSTRGAGPACPSTSGPARTCPVTCTEVRVELHRPPQQRLRRVRADAARHQLHPLPAQPADRDRHRRAGQGRRARGSSASNVELYLCNDHPDEMTRVRAAARRRDRRRDAAVRPRGRRRGGVAGRRQRARPTTPAIPYPRAHLGARRSRTASSTTTTTGTTRCPTTPADERGASQSAATTS